MHRFCHRLTVPLTLATMRGFILSTPTGANAATPRSKTASAASASDSCLSRVKTALGTAEKRQAKGIDFTCSSQGVTIKEAGAKDSTTKRIQDNLVHGESTTKSAQTGSSDSAACGISDEPKRTVVNELESTIEACVIYGQIDSPTNGTWVGSSVIDIEHYPYLSGALHKFHHSADVNSAVLISGEITPFKMKGLLPPVQQRPAAWGWHVSTGSPEFGNYQEESPIYSDDPSGYPRGVYSIQYHSLHVSVNSPAFSAEVVGDWSTPRFLCDPDERKQCYFPDGAEAPIL